jgi:hypothetical protein
VDLEVLKKVLVCALVGLSIMSDPDAVGRPRKLLSRIKSCIPSPSPTRRFFGHGSMVSLDTTPA